jgi:hypothetical protein
LKAGIGEHGESAKGGFGLRRPLEMDASDLRFAVLLHEIVLEGHESVAGRDPGRHGIVGHRNDLRGDVESARDMGGEGG